MTGKVVVTGFSQGGMLSYALALHHPELIEYALPISGMLPEVLWPTTPPPSAASARPSTPGTRAVAHARRRPTRPAEVALMSAKGQYMPQSTDRRLFRTSSIDAVDEAALLKFINERWISDVGFLQ